MTRSSVPERFMIQCDAPGCGRWYESADLRPPLLSAADASRYEAWHCDLCVPYHGPSRRRRRRAGLRKRRRIDFVRLNDPGAFLEDENRRNGLAANDVQDVDYGSMLRKWRARGIFRSGRGEGGCLLRLGEGEEFNADYAAKHGFSRPVLFRDVAPSRLGLRVPSPSDVGGTPFTFSHVAQLVGPFRPIQVIDTATQLTTEYTLQEWVDYMETPPRGRTRILNVITLEFSQTPLGMLVTEPKFARDVDFVNLHWPRTLEDIQRCMHSNTKQSLQPEHPLQLEQPHPRQPQRQQSQLQQNEPQPLQPTAAPSTAANNHHQQLRSPTKLSSPTSTSSTDTIIGFQIEKRIDSKDCSPVHSSTPTLTGGSFDVEKSTHRNGEAVHLDIESFVAQGEDGGVSGVENWSQGTEEGCLGVAKYAQVKDNGGHSAPQKNMPSEANVILASQHPKDAIIRLEMLERQRPRVTKYCLMSAAGSYTDFHVDFGGTAVWYHVFFGSKVFYLIEPTPNNLKIYSRWATNAGGTKTTKYEFLPDLIVAAGGDVYEVSLEKGQTLFIPSGWIHSVHTPDDSLVFGGNFVHRHSLEMQLEIHRLEGQMGVGRRFRFPNYQRLMWYAARDFLEECGGYANACSGDHNTRNGEPRRAQIICARYPTRILRGYGALARELERWSTSKAKLSVEQYPDGMDVVSVSRRLSEMTSRCMAYIGCNQKSEEQS